MFDYDSQKPQYPAWSQLAYLLMLCGVGLILGSFISFGLAKLMLNIPVTSVPDALKDPKNVNVSRLIQIVSTFFAMPLPVFIFAKIISRKPVSFIGFNKAISGKQVFIIIGIMLMGSLLSNVLSEVNAMIPLSKSTETYFKNLENQYTKEMMVLADMKNVQDYIVSLIIIAMLPAIFEEMLFRGALQQVMIRLTKNVFTGIIITSILFSAFHFSYYGFLSRLALGLIIGYIFYYSKNLWLASIAHFLYNAFGVTQLYALSRQGLLTEDALKDSGSVPLYWGLIAVFSLYFLFIFFKQESQVVRSLHTLSNNFNNENEA